MVNLPHRVVQALDQFNAAHPWDHNAHYHRWISRRLPKHIGSALDVGSGSGELARLLATRATTVRGIDIDPVITAHARAVTTPGAPVCFTVGDAVTDIEPGPYDVITCVAALHHMPFTTALTHLRRHLAPGGILVILGTFRACTPGDHLLGAVAIPLNVAMGWIKNKGRRAPRPVAMTARTRQAAMTFDDIVSEARRILPGARPRRRLFWRYTLVWHQS